ncbi:MAG: ABC transporter ATP-binding protein [Patescibacteria group bacterium]
MSKIILVSDLVKIYQKSKNTALKGVSFEIEKGETLAIMGKSGSGKSTLMHILGCLIKPTSGKVLINGKDVSNLDDLELSQFRNRTIGFVFQDFNLQNYFSAKENVALPAIIAGKSQAESFKKAEDILKIVGLGDKINSSVKELSGGQMQRVAIARALVNNPEIVLADEPTGNLDNENTEVILKLFNEISENFKITIIVVTHDEHVGKSFGRILKISDGKIA